MTNKNRVLKALSQAPKAGLTVAGIAERDLSGKLDAGKVEVALDRLSHQGRITELGTGHYALPD
jgi:hypothetical protein